MQFKVSLSRMIKLSLICFVMILTQGCTYNLWRTAVCRDLNLLGVQGVSVKSGAGEASQYLVFNYHRGLVYWVDYEYAISIENIPGILRYNGSERGIEAITTEISPQTIDKIKNYRFTQADSDLANKIKSNKNISIIFDYDPIKYGSYFANSGVCLVPYFLGAKNIGNEDSLSLFDPRCRIIILPAKQQRSIMSRFGGVFIAVAETPFTLISDLFNPRTNIMYYPF